MRKLLFFICFCCWSLVSYEVIAASDEDLKEQIAQMLKDNEAEIEADILKEFTAMDKNKDGKVGMDEFLQQKYVAEVSKADQEKGFKAIDKNKDNFISKEEMIDFTKSQMEVAYERMLQK